MRLFLRKGTGVEIPGGVWTKSGSEGKIGGLNKGKKDFLISKARSGVQKRQETLGKQRN